MRKLILLLGDLATGKSTYSHMLGKRYNALVLNKDTIKEKLGDTIGFKNREENKKLSNATFEVMDYVFLMMSQTGQDLILEANFHKEELQRLYRQCEEFNYEVLTTIFKADPEILHKRFLNRINNEHRHPVHCTQDLIDFKSFKQYILESRDINVEGQQIVINANDFSYQNEENYQVFDNFINRR